jgi:hypothetical protein
LEGENKGGKRRQVDGGSCFGRCSHTRINGLLPPRGSCAPGRTEDIAMESRENIGYKGRQDHPRWPRNPTRYGTNVPLPTRRMFSSNNQETDHNCQTQWHNMLHVCVNNDGNGDTIFRLKVQIR